MNYIYFTNQGIFASYPFFTLAEMSTVSHAMDQILGSAMLVLIIMAVTDSRNMNIPR